MQASPMPKIPRDVFWAVIQAYEFWMAFFSSDRVKPLCDALSRQGKPYPDSQALTPVVINYIGCSETLTRGEVIAPII